MNVSAVSGIDTAQFSSRINRTQSTDPSDFASNLVADRDGDGDGALSLDEMSSGERAVPEQLFNRADADGDGLLTEAEIAQGFERLQAKLQQAQSLFSQGGFATASGGDDPTSALLEALSQSQANNAYGGDTLLSLLGDLDGSRQGALDAAV